MGIFDFLLPSAEASPRMAEEARKSLGQGEVGANNSGPFVKSLMGQEGSPWCSAFVSQMAKQAGEDKFGYLPMARQWLNKGRQAGYVVDTPMEGDVVVWSRGKAPSGHTGIVNRVTPDGYYSIEGNVGAYPAKVREIFHPNKDSKRLGFVRMPPAQAKQAKNIFSANEMTFNQAFANARKNGLKKFDWRGNSYTTEVK